MGFRDISAQSGSPDTSPLPRQHPAFEPLEPRLLLDGTGPNPHGLYPGESSGTNGLPSCLGDVNGDGILDIVTDKWPYLETHLGNGDGTFADPVAYDLGAATRSVALADLDGNEVLDIVATFYQEKRVSVLFGNGDGTFSGHTIYNLANGAMAVLLGDLNGDEVTDIVALQESIYLSVLLGNGDGTFASPIAYVTPCRGAALGDVDGNNVLDIVTTDYSTNEVLVHYGNGDGTFAAGPTYATGSVPRSVALGDLDGNEALDIVTTNESSDNVSVYLGNGDGTFSEQVTYVVGDYPIALSLEDLDANGALDLVVIANGDFAASVLLGNGDGTFADQTKYRGAYLDSGLYNAPTVAIADVTGDAVVDIVTGTILTGNGDGTFAAQATYGVGSSAESVALDDLNHDGHADVVTANWDTNNVSVLLGIGDGTFDTQATYGVGDDPRSVALDDLNHDGHVDIVTANAGNVSVLLGLGDGTFAAQATYGVGSSAESVALDDLNHDGHVDIVTANWDANNVSVLLGNGDGTFATQATYGVGDGPTSVALDDLNHDGHVDIVAANVWDINVSVLLGIGDGTFAAQATYSAGNHMTEFFFSVALDDLNHDGHVDIVTANYWLRDNVSVLLGNGDGTFATPATYRTHTGRARSRSVALADLNHDGHVDIVTANLSFYNVSVLLGIGDGTFATQATYSVRNGPFSVALDDLNHDGHVDIVTANGSADNVSVLLFRSKVRHAPNGPAPAPVSAVEFRFRDTMDMTSFSVTDDVASFIGPGGPLAADGYQWHDSHTLEVTFQPQTVNGGYEMVIGPNILDNQGNALDLDGDGVPGETPDDVYRASFAVDATGPYIVRQTPEGDVAGTMDHVTLYFNEAVNMAGLALADIEITTPSGPVINPSSLVPVTTSVWEVWFPAQTDPGECTMTVRPLTADLAGNLMDQDRDGTFAEEPDDVYTGSFHLVDVDLQLTNVSVVGTELWSGEPVGVSWEGYNDKGASLVGNWTDAVYLSADNQWDIDDVLLETVDHTDGLSAGGTYSWAVAPVVPSTMPGDYYVIVRADLYNQEKEGGDEGNNVVAVGPIPLQARPLPTDGVPVAGTLSGPDPFDSYSVATGTGEQLGIVLTGAAVAAGAELFVSFETVPTRMDYDYRGEINFGGNGEVLIPHSPGGTYYVLVYADQLDAAAAYEISASTSELLVTGISPERHGDGSTCEMTITGSGFDETTTIEFAGTDLSIWTPTNIQVLSPTIMLVTLDVPAWPQDVYDIVVTKPGVDPYEMEDSFEVTGGVPNLETRLIVPDSLGRSWRHTIWVEYSNTGQASMPAPLLKVHGDDNAMLTLDPSLNWSNAPLDRMSDTVQVMATGSGATPGILQPGDFGRIPVYCIGLKPPWDGSDWTVEFDLGVLTADEAEPIDWAGLKDEMRPESMPTDTWDAIWANLTDQVGTTWGDYVAMLNENMNYLHQVGQDTSDTSSLLGFEIAQASALGPYATLTGDVDAYSPAPGIPLVFGRVFGQSIDSRYELGPLGRGWSHNWDISVEELSEGDVVIHGPYGRDRYFQKEGSTYAASPGDYGALTFDGSKFRLTEKHGTVWQFRSDNLLDYVQDTNANRITAGYSSGRLTSLTHLNGNLLLLDYNLDGRIWHVTDPRGTGPEDDLVTTFEYDPSGEYLRTATAPGDRVTTYSYETASTPPQKTHALLSVQYPDGTHDYFGYDDQGRLEETHYDGGAEAVAYDYDSAGVVTVADATARQSIFYFGLGGQFVRVRDGEGNVISLAYDSDYQLTGLTGGSGEQYGFSYDSVGNIVGIEDPLRNDTAFSYTPTFNDLESVVDPRNNGVLYDYDPVTGNLRSITYEDGTRETFTYHPDGTLHTWTNRRGNETADPDDYMITYDRDYHPSGQLNELVKTTYSSDGTPSTCTYTCTYDVPENRISVTDDSGTTTLSYDPDTDWLKRIDYPGGQFFTFDYDDLGRRSDRIDQHGDVVNYIYYDSGDNIRRLDRMTDGADALIVNYDYDDAGRLDVKTLGNGVYTTYDYDDAGRMTHLVNFAPDDSVLSRFDYTYDASGRRDTMTVQRNPANPFDGTYTYGYDPLGQLVSVSYPDSHVVEYVYDAVGNRIEVIDDGISTAYTTNDMNQYTDVGDVTYTFDDDGNMTSKTEGAVTTYYTYDIENRLIGVTTPTDTWSYTYDAFGNRTASTHNGVTINYIVDPIGYGDVAAEYDGDGDLIARYDHGFGLLARTDAADASGWYTFDAIGSTSELTDNAGAIQNAYTYDPFGISLTQSAMVANPFQYIGEYGVMDNANGLSYMRARHYLPDLGRFAIADPLRLGAGDMNLYTYCSNDPIGHSDPSGLRRSLGTILKSIGTGIWEMVKAALPNCTVQDS